MTRSNKMPADADLRRTILALPRPYQHEANWLVEAELDDIVQLITTYAASERVRAVNAAIASIYIIANDLAIQDGLRGSESISPYIANAITIYQEYLKGDTYERIDVSTLGLPTIDKLLKEQK